MMEHDAPLSPVEVYLRSGGPPYPDFEYVNYEDELRAVENIAKLAASARIKSTVVAFGWPGNGTRAFAQKLAQELFQEFQYSIGWLDVRALVSLSTEAIERAMAPLREVCHSTDARPLLLVATELDSLSSALAQNDGLKGVISLLEDSFSESSPGALTILATATSPLRAATIFPTEETALVYFDWPDKPAKVADLLEMLQFPRAAEVAAHLISTSETLKVTYTAASVINGTSRVLAVTDHEMLARMDASEVAGVIRRFCSPTQKAEVEEYRELYGRQIATARSFVLSRRNGSQ